MKNPLFHAASTLCRTSSDKITFYYIGTVVTAWKSPVDWWETKILKKTGRGKTCTVLFCRPVALTRFPCLEIIMVEEN